MPTYEFRCPDGHTFDRFYRKISDGVSEVPCPECGKPATRQLSGGAGLVFKGAGFYLTDYGKNAHRRGGGAAGAGKDEGASSGGESKSGETKPAESASKPADKPATDAKSSGGDSGTKSDK